MRKILPILLLFVCASLAADTTGTWASIGGTRLDSLAAYTWSPAQPGGFTADVILVFDATSNVAATSTNALSIKAVSINTGHTGAVTFGNTITTADDFTSNSGSSSNISWSGRTLTCGGDLSLDATGTLNLGTGITMTGNSALLHIGSTAGAVTATSCAVTFNGAGCTLDDDKGATFKSLTLGASASLISSGGASSVFTNAGTCLIIGNNSKLTINRAVTFNNSGAGSNFHSFGTNDTINGTATITWVLNATTTINFPAYTYSGSGTTDIVSQAGTSPTLNITGDLTTPGTLRLYNNNASTSYTANISANVSCGTLQMGANNATASMFVSYGSGNHTITTYNIFNTGATTDSLKTCTMSCSGSWTFGTNHTVVPGSSIVRATGTGTWTMAGKRFATWVDSTPSTSTVTLGDSLMCDSALYIKSGKFNQNGKVIYTRDYSNTSPDTVKMSANLNISRNYTRGSPTIVSRTGGGMIFDTASVAHTATLNNNAIGPVVCRNMTFADSGTIQKLTISDSGIVTFKNSAGLRIDTLARTGGSSGKVVRWLSSVAGSAARIWVKAFVATYMYFKDIASSEATITATDASNEDGTGNSGINFGVVCNSPSISAQPAPITVTAPTPAIFAVIATGDPVLSYQWQKGTTNISGATNSSYTTPATSRADTNSTYRVIVSNSCGADTSDAASLLVAGFISLTSNRPEYSKLAGGGQDTLTGVNCDWIDSLWVGDSAIATAGITKTTTRAIFTLPAYGSRGGVDIRVKGTFNRDTIFGLSYKNLHVNSMVPPQGMAGDTVRVRAIWGLGTTGLTVKFDTATASVVAGYNDTSALVVAPAHPNGTVSVEFVNGDGDTTFTSWKYGPLPLSSTAETYYKKPVYPKQVYRHPVYRQKIYK